jgi:nucleotide-binding universal stress UspA family protein
VEVSSRRVIAGVSGSVRSLGALRAGVVEARSNGAELVAVLAWAPVGGESGYLRAPCPLLLRLCEEAAQQRVREAFDAALGGVPGDVAVRLLVVRARPGPVLVDLAARPDDLLVVGCGGRNWPSTVFHGSVTRYCIAHARCPVLAVPPPELITDLRPWPHRWRPDVVSSPPAGAASKARNRVDPEPGAGPATRAIAPAGSAGAGAAGPPGPVSHPGAQEAWAKDHLPAYHGAPYHQPRPPSRAHRALRRLRLAAILATVIALAAVSLVLLAQSASRP